MTHFRKRLEAPDIADIQSVLHRKYLEYLKSLEEERLKRMFQKKFEEKIR